MHQGQCIQLIQQTLCMQLIQPIQTNEKRHRNEPKLSKRLPKLYFVSTEKERQYRTPFAYTIPVHTTTQILPSRKICACPCIPLASRVVPLIRNPSGFTSIPCRMDSDPILSSLGAPESLRISAVFLLFGRQTARYVLPLYTFVSTYKN